MAFLASHQFHMVETMKKLFNYSMLTCERHQRWQQHEQKLPLATLKKRKKLKTMRENEKKRKNLLIINTITDNDQHGQLTNGED